MIIVDSMMLIRRCHAKMDFLKNKDGVPTGLEFGSLRTLEMLEKKFPDHPLMLCFDSVENLKKDGQYKANRKPLDDSFYKRLNKFKTFLKQIWPTCEKRGYEADDLMHSISQVAIGPHYIYTNDHDLLQSVNDKVQVLKSFKSQLYFWDSAKVLEKYGVPPRLLPEFFAFTGDKVDNLPGVPRIRKEFLARLILWADVQGKDIVEEVRSAAWPPKLLASIIEFLDEGLWHYNYKLMKLNLVSPMQIEQPNKDENIIGKRLLEWGIASLRMCDNYRHVFEEQLKDEEF